MSITEKNKLLAARIKNQLIDKGKNQADLARDLQIPESMVSRWLAGNGIGKVYQRLLVELGYKLETA